MKFDISGSSSFKPGNSASQFQERSFLSEEATVQRNVTNGLTLTLRWSKLMCWQPSEFPEDLTGAN